MTLDIPLSAEAEKRLRARAAAAQVELSTYVAQLVEEVARKPSIDEMLAPLRERFAASGISEAELAEDFEREKDAMRAERRTGKSA